MTQGFNDNLYLIDLSYLKTPAEVVYDLSSILDNELAKNRRVKLKLGEVEFNKSQLLSIKSLIESINSTLAIVDGKSEITRNSAIAIGLVYQNSNDMVTETVFNDNQKNENGSPVLEEVKSELFPDVSPVKTENEEIEENSEQEEKNENESDEESAEENFSESIEIQPQKFDTNDENLDFDNENKKEWFEAEEEPKILEEGFANNNWANPKMPDNVSDNEVSEENETVNTDITIREDDILDSSNENNNEGSVEIDLSSSDSIGIQSLDDIPLDNNVIQEELNVIYSAERKLDSLFEKTGLKEEKFSSIKETAHAEEREYTQYDFEIEAFPTKYLKQTIFAGQVISFDGNLVVIGDCHEGSEISASGDVTVWGNLSGSVHAGKNGNEKCRVRALSLNASQIKIANCFRKRPVALDTQTQPPTDAAPQEAMISKGEIVVYKIYK